MGLDVPNDDMVGGLLSATQSGCPVHACHAGVHPGEKKAMLLTGASRGIGHATAKLFSQAGWRIISCARQPFDRERCPWESGNEDHVQVDLGNHRMLPRVITEVKKRLAGAPLHALVNNAGVSPKSSNGGRLTSLTTSPETWMRVFHLNLVAPIMLAQGLFEELRAASGSIVNVTSIAGSRVHPFAGSAYATSKAALASLTREMAHDYAPHGIRVNAIAPGEIQTSMLSLDTEARLVPSIPLRRVGTPDEVAKVIFFLCSDAASYVTGAEVPINGGQHL
ncbi:MULTISPECIES: SDR family NAD(P)-dependent oxidoreductase [unclassified Bradyrhizobium]|uniref:SDR family NAD(P)-dependent oxidoreductase n=1 Tax=unclassified Bradyrhizobium TaxID=2631580 RepID=UPI00048C7328|nr:MULTISPECIES: SDR family oxidoreductase [unclassified Bradyrhizobium]MCK7667152.1 SDR family oxidoreductase [Bradyrhizobium sp. 2S1]QIG94529.1 SDR family oxidoreductase [Bradyrhizobium sp. 6(2017)]